MLKKWCSIKEIEVYLLCEILISKDTLQGQKKLLRASLSRECGWTINDLLQLAGEFVTHLLCRKIYMRLPHTKRGSTFDW